VKGRRDIADPRVVERYIRGGVMPRFMQRLRDIDAGLARHRRLLGHLYADVGRTHGHDPEVFERRWREVARSWRFDDVNELIDQHNECYPIERNLPVNPRTGDYVSVRGRSFRRERVGREWVLERFPAGGVGGVSA
jgi:hypothetical protein